MKRARLPIAVLASLLLHLGIAGGVLRVAYAEPAAAVSSGQRISVSLWNAPKVAAEFVEAPVVVKPARAKRVTVKGFLSSPVGDGVVPAADENAATADTVSVTTAGASGGTGPVQEGTGVDLFPLNQKLRNAARSCYPQVAARFRLQGTAKVAFCVGNHGEASQVRLVQSTGSGVLDAAAGGCVLERARPLPAETSGRCFELPVQFEAGT